MADTDMYDLIVIGAGPGGYIAAERAGARGLRVLLAERRHLGGVCLNEGCVPSKTLLNSAKLFHHATHAAAYGVVVEGAAFKLDAAMKRKEKVIATLRKGIAYQMKRHGVTVVEGAATVVDRQTVEVDGRRYHGRNLLLATGAEAVRIPILGADLPHVMTNREILQLAELPRRVAIIGGGVIGLEFASFFSSVGVAVAVIEMLPEILPSFDPELAAGLRRAMPGVTFHTGCRVEAISAESVTFSCDGASASVPADVVLMSVGRRPNTSGMGLEKIGVDIARSGIRVNDRMQTNVPGVYAVGDVNGVSPLAHSASRMGEVAVNVMGGRRDVFRRDRVPWVVYTYLEVAGVGLRADQAEARGHRVETVKLPLSANGRCQAENERPPGFCKIVVDADTRLLLGVHMLGTYASELIYGAAVMMEAELRVDDVRDICFPHPTVGEIMRDAIWEIGM